MLPKNMAHLVLVCSAPHEDTEDIVAKLKTIGIEARDVTLELQGEEFVPENQVVARRTPNSPSLAFGVSRGRSELSRCIVMALCSPHRHDELPSFPKLPELPQQAIDEIAKSLEVDKMLVELLYENRQKPDWQRPGHQKPRAQWTNRPHTFNPARSRAKGRMR